MLMRKRASVSLALFVLMISLSLTSCQAFVAVSTPNPIATKTPGPTPTPSPPSGVFWVDTSKELGEINKLVLGTNHGPWADLGAGNIESAKKSGITFLRWPGGNWGDINDPRTNLVDNYILAARNIMNAEPSITVRLIGSTLAQAAQLVQYVNIDKGYKVKYWSIGNEPDLYVGVDSSWTPEFYAKQWRDFALAMKAVDPSIKFYGPDISDFVGDVDHFDARELLYAKSVKLDVTKRDYLIQFLKVNADLVDIVTVHRYPFPQDSKQSSPTWEQLQGNTSQWDRIIPNLHRVIKETTGSDKPVGITEFNSDASNSISTETSPDSFKNALWLSDVLGRLIRQRPEMLAYFSLKTKSSGHGLMDAFDVRPSYYVYQIYKQFGSHLLASNSDAQYVSIYAAKRDDGALTVILVNLNDNEVRKPLQLDKGDALKLTEAYLFDATHKAEAITTPSFTNGNEIVLPAQSVLMYIFK